MAHKIVFLDRDTIAPFTNLRAPAFDHDWTDYGKTTQDQVVERLAGATICINNKVPIRRESIEQLPDLKLVAMAATGTDCMDLEACKEHGITVSNIQGYATNTVPEHAFALIMALSRQIVGYRQDVEAGEWQKAGQFCFFTHKIWDLAGKKIGIVGEGNLGQGVAKIARGLDMEIMFAAHKGATGLGPLYTPFDQVVETADVITLHCPLLPSTRNLFGRDEFQKMKDHAIIVNTARGGLIDEEALVEAIEQGWIGGAGIDVVSTEPPADDHPFFKLKGHPNFILTPHVAWASQEAMQSLADQLIDNVENFVTGTPSNVVEKF